jgi:hypothetical protein
MSIRAERGSHTPPPAKRGKERHRGHWILSHSPSANSTPLPLPARHTPPTMTCSTPRAHSPPTHRPLQPFFRVFRVFRGLHSIRVRSAFNPWLNTKRCRAHQLQTARNNGRHRPVFGTQVTFPSGSWTAISLPTTSKACVVRLTRASTPFDRDPTPCAP